MTRQKRERSDRYATLLANGEYAVARVDGCAAVRSLGGQMSRADGDGAR